MLSKKKENDMQNMQLDEIGIGTGYFLVKCLHFSKKPTKLLPMA
jgi:hypothetical protein